ncbi:MAG: MBL fold metallo-hydrolase [Elusimicrobia bacterium]|nr:MBL fold metallo-hydrolase [Elusimicrobiota bacterium]
MARITTIDCEYLFPQIAASFLLEEGDKALFIENNTARCIPLLMKALESAGKRPEQVKYLIITHVHLDHAAGSRALLDACPNAVLLCHPRAERHVVDPSKLIAGVKQVYGERFFEEVYGDIRPVPAQRIRAMQDGEVLRWGSRELVFLHTRGHANHHFCVYDPREEAVFTGDSFGMAFPALQKNGLFIYPSTSPTDFDPAQARAGVQKILQTGAKRAFLTHFGEISALQAAASQILEGLDFSEKLMADAAGVAEADLTAFCEGALRGRFRRALERLSLASDPKAWDHVNMDIQLNAAGIAHAARKRR